MSAETTADSLLAELNDAQRRAATHGHDPLLIVAGAGTGKTATLTRRVAWLIAGGRVPAPASLTVLYSDTRTELPPLQHARRAGHDDPGTARG